MISPRLTLIVLLILGMGTGWIWGAQDGNIHVKSDETATDTIISISNPVRIDGHANKGVFTAGAPLTVAGTVDGDVAVIGGKLILEPQGQINGNVLLVGSTQELAPTARINGKLFTTPFLQEETREIFRDPAGFLFSYDYDFRFIAGRVFTSLIWFVLSILILKLFPAHIAFAASRMRRDPGYTAGIGVVGTTGLLVLLLISLALCLILIGIPIFLILLVFLLSAWVFGIVVVFCVVGEQTLKLLRIRRRSPIMALVVAIALWTLIKFLPGISLLVHVSAFIMSMGIALATRFGTGTPWLRRRLPLAETGSENPL